ncbi:MAG: OB-fold domain-containing protein [Actinobacteria bacterium]|nr:OB-fold domain-containing protein [Actinomycetota bacterium]
MSDKNASVGAPAEVYRRYLKAGELGFQRCEGCGAAVFYPRVLCPICGGASLAWETSGGRGTVYATTAVYRRDRDPYNVVLVDLEEGFRIMSRVEGVPAVEVKIGMPVRLRVDETEEGAVAVFVSSEGSGDGR